MGQREELFLRTSFPDFPIPVSGNSRFRQFPIPFLILRRPIVWYNSHVKMILATVAVLSAFVTANAVETTLHSCPPPDTEFETNLVAEVWDSFDRIMSIRFEFAASPSNNVQAAFGVDEDHDGVLSIEESEFTVGWDCGAWFVSGYGEEFAEPAAVQSGTKSFSWRARMDTGGRLCELSAKDGNAAVFSGLTNNIPGWVCRRCWDTMRLTARGAVDPAAVIYIGNKPNPLQVILR